MAAAGLGAQAKLEENAPAEFRNERLLLLRGIADFQIIDPLSRPCPLTYTKHVYYNLV
jgi:hypothetical protein